MKKVFNIILIVLALFSFISGTHAQTQEQISYNKEYNDILYLCKESWSYLENKGANTIKIYNGNDSIVKTYTFHRLQWIEEVESCKIILIYKALFVNSPVLIIGCLPASGWPQLIYSKIQLLARCLAAPFITFNTN